ncbi:SLC13 family permease [Collimonas sp.]|jgi:Na+/H+ antiporter NhaD/arsenite permease-like protein|uniref:SLC13 family permease n=1 Tax=Collimonas sp. TaxID=1963772 RepID=UPI002B5200BA|nr:SLC13 family permease [Collimonas sp.]HWW05334.1 SLC13 family permease [Collimonas sp.]
MLVATESIHPPSPIEQICRPFLRDRLMHLLLLVAILLSTLSPQPLAEYRHWVDWNTIATLAGMLLLTKGIEVSGYLEHLGRRIINRLQQERVLAIFLVSASALLSTLLTNDIALFVMVPLTVGLGSISGLPIGRLVIFEALAVNAGSLLTPIGNPQNILLWQRSHLSFTEFTWQMAPLALAIFLLLLLATWFCFPKQTIHVELEDDPAAYRVGLLRTCGLLYLAFLAMVELGHPGWGLLGVAAAALLFCREIVAKVDWSLILVFILMFIDIRLLTQLHMVQEWVAAIPHFSRFELFMSALLGSQIVSNVPAAILLVNYSTAYKVIAYGVNAAGFGLAIGSLANIIALRMAPERHLWLRFHLYSFPFLVLSALMAWSILA